MEDVFFPEDAEIDFDRIVLAEILYEEGPQGVGRMTERTQPGEQAEDTTLPEPFAALITENSDEASQFLAEERRKGSEAWLETVSEAPGPVTYRVMVRPAFPAAARDE